MSEQEQQTPEEMQAELARLRRTNSELLQKASNRKSKLTEAEARITELQTLLDGSQKDLYQARIGVPLKALADEVSTMPTLWLKHFNEEFSVAWNDGVLAVTSKDGKPATDEKGNPVPLEPQAISKLVTRGDTESAKLFSALTTASRASGAAGGQEQPTSRQVASQKHQHAFGLR